MGLCIPCPPKSLGPFHPDLQTIIEAVISAQPNQREPGELGEFIVFGSINYANNYAPVYYPVDPR